MTDEQPARPLSESGPLAPGFEMRYSGERGAKGDTGERGEKGDTGARGLTSRTARAIVSLFLLAFVIAGSSLLLTTHYVHASQATEQRQERAFEAAERREQLAAQQAGAAVIRKLCASFAELAANKPPGGNPRTNPSRAFDQRQHKILDGLGPDIGCGR